MEKKIRYLMLLLCLCLFPMKAFALENSLEDTNKEVDNVVVDNISYDENQEDLQKIEDPNKVQIEENSNEQAGEEPENEKPEGETTDPTGKENENVENKNEEHIAMRGNVSTNDPVDLVTTTELTEVQISGVDTDLASGKAITFGATSLEPDKYIILSEEWYYGVYQGSQYHSSDLAQNEYYQSEGIYFETPVEDGYYDYSFVIKVADGYSLPEEIIVTIDGTEYQAYAWTNDYINPDNNEYYIDVFLQVLAKNSEATYLDSLTLENVVLDAYVGQGPLYSATSATEHLTVFSEIWEFYKEYQRDDENIDYYYYSNASNPEVLYEDVEQFDTFEAGYEYYYGIIVQVDGSYRLASAVNNDGSEYYNVIINGQQVQASGNGYLDEQYGYIYTLFITAVEPTEADTYEVAENPDPVLDENAIEDITIGVDGDFSEFEIAYVDGNVVAEENYEVDTENGSITFLQAFLNALKQGTHEIALRFANGLMAYTTLTINGKEEETTPATPTIVETASGETVQAMYTTNLSEKEVKKDPKLQTKDKEKTKADEKEKSNVGLIIFLIILILIAIAIPITVYKEKQ